MNLPDLFLTVERGALLLSCLIYFALTAYLVCGYLIRRERRLSQKKMILAFLSLFLLVVEELLLSNMTATVLSGASRLPLFCVKLFIGTSLFILYVYQSIGFISEGIGIGLVYQSVIAAILLAIDLLALRQSGFLANPVPLSLLFMGIVASFLLLRFFSMCLKRYESILHTIQKENFIEASVILGGSLIIGFMVVVSIQVDHYAATLPTFVTLVALHLGLYYRNRKGGEMRRNYNLGVKERYIPLVEELGDEDYLDDYKIIQRLIRYFEKEKPYLNQELKLADVSKEIYTNKTYLSRALNQRMSKNFNQFVNYYRVKEACRLFLEDPMIKIGDMCTRSGFKSIASFSNAFNLNIRYTPAEWCKEVRKKLNNNEDVSVNDYFD